MNYFGVSAETDDRAATQVTGAGLLPGFSAFGALPLLHADAGLSGTMAAFVALSRKLAKVRFALLQNNSRFDPLAQRSACMAT
jgi:hypothetical protein